MGRHFLEHLGGQHYYCCANCNTYLTNRKEIVSQNFRGATGAAFLFKNVVNINYSEMEVRAMLTGKHMVRDVFCKKCFNKLGWMYEFAYDSGQTYKEGYIILERRLMHEIEEKHPFLAERQRLFTVSITRTSSNSSVSSSGISSVTVT